MNTLKTIAVVLIVFVVFVNLPAKYFSLNYWLQYQKLGANVALTDISGNDNLSDYPSVQNANNTILEDVLNSIIGTTTISTLTTAASLATVGTITSGTWSGTAVAATKGGTGQTTVTSGDLLYGSASNVWSKLAKGSDGQFLTLSGGFPAWAASAIDQTANYLWTGVHNFTNASTLIKGLVASTTIQFNNGGSGISYTFPLTSHAASSTVLMEDGSGSLTFNLNRPIRYTFATTTTTSVTNGFATSTFITIPASTLTGSSTISFKGNFICDNSANGDQACSVFLRKSSGETFATLSVGTDQATSQTYGFTVDVLGNNSVSSQTAIGFSVNQTNARSTSVNGGSSVSDTSTIDWSSALPISVVVQSAGANTTATISNYSLVISP